MSYSKWINPWGNLRKAEAERDKLQRTVDKLTRAIEKGLMYHDPPRLQLDYPRAAIQLESPGKHARKRTKATSKEPFTVEWIESLPAGDVLYDIGANVGAYSLIAAKRPQGPLRVVAFEPAFATYALLCANVVHNQAEEHVLPLPVTLGAQTGLGTFEYGELEGGAAHHSGGIESDVEPSYSQQVLIYRLDELVERFELPAPQHLKVDVDGAELMVLRGARQSLLDHRLRNVLVETQPELQQPLEDLLRECGLRAADRFERPALSYVLYSREPGQSSTTPSSAARS